MRHDDDAYLLDILLSARDVLDFAAGLIFTQFEESRLHQNASLKSIEIIGEAAARISPKTRHSHPDIPWAEIIGMGNRLVHAYFEVNLERVWYTVQQDLPRLINLIEPLVPPEVD